MPSTPLDAICPRDLRLVRQVLGLSLSAVADQVGLDRSALSRIENGHRPLTPDVAIKILRVLFPGAERAGA